MSHADDHSGSRRDFLYYATAGAGAVAAGAAVWPLVNQMNPSADTRALASIAVDIAGVEVGTQLTVKWRGKPVFIRNRTAKEIEEAKAVKLEELKAAGADRRESIAAEMDKMRDALVHSLLGGRHSLLRPLHLTLGGG